MKESIYKAGIEIQSDKTHLTVLLNGHRIYQKEHITYKPLKEILQELSYSSLLGSIWSSLESKPLKYFAKHCQSLTPKQEYFHLIESCLSDFFNEIKAQQTDFKLNTATYYVSEFDTDIVINDVNCEQLYIFNDQKLNINSLVIKDCEIQKVYLHNITANNCVVEHHKTLEFEDLIDEAYALEIHLSRCVISDFNVMGWHILHIKECTLTTTKNTELVLMKSTLSRFIGYTFNYLSLSSTSSYENTHNTFVDCTIADINNGKLNNQTFINCKLSIIYGELNNVLGFKPNVMFKNCVFYKCVLPTEFCSHFNSLILN